MRKFFLLANTCLLIGFYGFMILVFLGKKSSSFSLDSISSKDFKLKILKAKNQRPRDNFMVLEEAFGVKTKNKQQVTTSVNRPTFIASNPKISLNVTRLVYFPREPSFSYLWVSVNGQNQLIKMEDMVQGYTLKKIEPFQKKQQGDRREVEYKIYLQREGKSRSISFFTWETSE